MLSKILNFVPKSIFLKQIKYKFMHKLDNRAEYLLDFYKSENDLFYDYRTNPIFLKLFSPKEAPIVRNSYSEENFHYGNFETLNRFSGDYESLCDYIVVKHGATMFNDSEYMKSTSWMSRLPIITHGKFANNSRKKLLEYNIPTFAVGPFTYYAKPIYQDNEIQSLKKKLGKTIVIFPSHSHEWSKINYSAKDFSNLILNTYKNYDTIIVNTYWADYFCEFNEIMRAAGGKISCCGHRINPYFTNNLRTLFEIADVTAGNDVGSNVGYSLFHNKPFHFIDCDIAYKPLLESKADNFIQNGGLDDLRKILRQNFLMKSNAVEREQLEILNPYWGFDCVRTKEEMAAIFEIITHIKIYSFTVIDFVPNAIKILLKKYEHDKKKQLHLRLLKESLDIAEQIT